jgi:hypothetical protein
VSGRHPAQGYPPGILRWAGDPAKKVFYNHFNKKRSCQFYTGKSVSCVIQKYRQG